MNELLEQVAAHFQINLSEIQVEPIQHGKLQKHNVCRYKIGTESFLLKQHDITVPVTESGFTPFQIERYTLSTLHRGGHHVPKIVWESEQHNTLVLAWCGDETLDSLAQNKSETDLMPVLNTILHEMCQLETFFMKNREQFLPYVFHFNFKKTLYLLIQQGKKTIGYLQHLSKTPLTDSRKKHLDSAWTILSNRLLEAPTTLDSLDYQAHNIVIDGEAPFFIDYASIGWDSQERRLVQFFNSIGAYQEGGNFVSLLNRELVEIYSEWVVQHREDSPVTDIIARVDAHHLLFYLTVVHKIIEAVARPDASENKNLMKSWGDMRLRFQRAVSLIINVGLSDDVNINLIREMIGEFHADTS